MDNSGREEMSVVTSQPVRTPNRFFSQKEMRIQLLLFIAFLIGFIIRAIVIGKSGFHADEIDKIMAAQHYKDFDFTHDPEHPALMKLAITISTLFFGENEFAVRFPNVLLASLTVYPIFYLGRILYSDFAGILACFMWSLHITAISFSIVAKEDTFMTFFGTSAYYFYLRSREDHSYMMKMGICLGLTFASKYTGLMFSGLILITQIIIYEREVSYTNIKLITTKIALPGIFVFLIFNFPILIPGTYTEFQEFSDQPRIHSGHLFLGKLLNKRPYYVLVLHLLLKTPLSFLILLFVGVGLALKFRTDTDELLLIWGIIPFVYYSFTPSFGKVPRYYHVAEPAFVLIVAIASIRISTFIVSRLQKTPALDLNKLIKSISLPNLMTGFLVGAVLINSLVALTFTYPYYRIYVNELAGGQDKATYYLQDSVYDYYLKEAIEYLNDHAPENSTIAVNAIKVANYYGRSDLAFKFMINLPEKISDWSTINVSYAIVQDSRTKLENYEIFKSLRNFYTLEKLYTIEGNTIVEIYALS